MDLSLSIYVNAPLKVGMSVYYPSNECHDSTPAKLKVHYGLTYLGCGVSVGFVVRHFDLRLSSGYSRMKSTG